jgi:peptide/nickel transport system permease protein
MTTFILRRILQMIPTLFIISVITFIIIQLPPGDFATSIATQLAMGGSSADSDTIAALQKQYGLDQPLHIQYLKWISGFPRGDFGWSFEWRRPVAELIGGRLALTLALSFLSLLFMWCIAIPIGIYSARHKNSFGDNAFTALGFFALSVPDFLLGLFYLFIGIFVFGVSVSGLFSAEYEKAPWSVNKALDLANHLIWPALILGAAGIAQLIRIMRSSLLETLGQPFIQVARAKGLNEKLVVNRHAVRVAINPLISVMGMQLPLLISGATVLGLVLSLPTTGPMFVRALLSQDMYLAGTFLLLLSVLLMIGNLLADIALALADPRIRIE